MISVISLLNLVLCSYVTSAFVMQMIVHFPFMDWDYAGDNLKYTAYWYAIPLIAEMATAWSEIEKDWYPVTTILLCLGWLLCIPLWYYQIKLSPDNVESIYPTQSTTETIIVLSRARGVVWLARFIMLTIWIDKNM